VIVSDIHSIRYIALRNLLTELGIQVWSLRQSNVSIPVVAAQIIGAEKMGYLLFDGKKEDLQQQPNARLLSAMLKAIGYHLGAVCSSVAASTTLLLAIGPQATSQAITHYAGINNLITIPYSLQEILAKPIRKKQVWMEILNLYL
jgi:hypothetical protein